MVGDEPGGICFRVLEGLTLGETVSDRWMVDKVVLREKSNYARMIEI